MRCRFLILVLVGLFVGSLGCGCKLTEKSIRSLDKHESKWRLAEKELMDEAPTAATRLKWKGRVKANILVLRAIKADAKGETFDIVAEAKKLGMKTKENDDE